MTKFYDAVYSFEPFEQWLLAVSKPEVRMRVTSAWGEELHKLIYLPHTG